MLWKNTQHSWAGGQLDAELMGRQDLEKYFTGACEIENMSIRRQGNLIKRRGTGLVADIHSLFITDDTTGEITNDAENNARLFPIVVDKEEGYYLLWVGGYIYLVSSNGVRTSNPTAVTWSRTPTQVGSASVTLSEDGINPQEVNYCQIGDNVYLAHKDFAPCVVKVDYDSLRYPLVLEYLEFNSCKWSAPGIKEIDDANMHKGTKSVTVQYNANLGVTKTVNTTTYSLSDKEKYLESTLYQYNTTYSTWVQTARAQEKAGMPVNTVYYVATYVKDGIESPPCQPVSQDYLAPWEDGGYLKIKLKINENAQGTNTTAPDYYKVYKRTGTDFGLIATVKGTSTTEGDDYVIDDYINPDLSVQPPPTGDIFTDEGDYPSCVGQYQQRLIYASTTNDPFKFWMSAVGDLLTFEPHETILESDALSAELAATEAPNINHIAFNRDIVMFTDGGEWRVSAVSGNALTYKTLSATLQSGIGSVRYVTPITVGSELLFVERSGQTIRSLGYNFSSDGYETRDLSILAQSMFAGRTIKRMCYRQYPESTIYCVLDDGTIAALVYMKEHDVIGWTHITLGGPTQAPMLAQDIAANKKVSGGSSEVMAVVKNSAGTAAELWALREESLTQTVSKQVCLDGAQTLAQSAVASAWKSGWVAVNTENGAVYSAAAAVPSGATVVCGFPFTARMTTVYPEPRGTGTAQFEIKNGRSCEVRVYKSGDFTVRSACLLADKATAVSLGVTADDGEYSLVTKDCRVNLVGANARDGRVVIESTAPTPLNILSLSTVYQIEAEDQESEK